MKNAINLKLIYESASLEDTEKRLKETLSKIINDPNMDIFLQQPETGQYDRVTQ